MQPQLILIDSLEGLEELQSYLANKTYVAYDCETTGLNSSDQVIGFSICASEARAFYIILAFWHCGQLVWNPLSTHAIELLKSLQSKSLIMHNGIFDCMMAESNFKVSLINSLHTDTMVLAHLLNENRRVGLKELAKEYFGEDATAEAKEMQSSVLANGGVWSSKQKEMYKADSQLLGKYGAKDAWLTYKLFMELIPELDHQGLTKFFYEDESMPLLRGPTYQLNTTGLQVDSKALTILKKTLEAECAEAKAFIHQEIAVHIKTKYPGTNKKTTFNIGSGQQLSWLLFGELGLEFGTLTKGGKQICKQMGLKLPYTAVAKRTFIHACLTREGEIYQPAAIVNGKKKAAKKIQALWKYIESDKKTLLKIAPKLKWVAELLKYKTKLKLLNTYIAAIESKVQYGILRPSYLQHGTVTGRYSSRNPNLQNLPRDDQRVKNCFVSRPGKVFVSADFSQLEPRTFAAYSKDKKLMAAFDGTSDFYSVVGMPVYDKYDCLPQKEGPDSFGVKYKKYRDWAKIIALASAYGATPNKLSHITGKSVEDTAADMEKYFESFPGVQTMMLEAHNLAKQQGYVTNLFGRVRRIPEAMRITKIYGNVKHWDLPYDARKILNMACNFRIQSTGASIVNRAMIAVHNACNNYNLKVTMVSQIHDEIVLECDVKDATEVSVILQTCMEQTTILPGVVLEAIPRVSKTLAK